MRVQLSTNATDPILQVAAIKQIASGLIAPLLPPLSTTIAGLTTATVNLPATQTILAGLTALTPLYPLKVNAAAVATCETPSVPAGSYTNLNAVLTSTPPPQSSAHIIAAALHFLPVDKQHSHTGLLIRSAYILCAGRRRSLCMQWMFSNSVAI